jgi:hypothetical protein
LLLLASDSGSIDVERTGYRPPYNRGSLYPACIFRKKRLERKGDARVAASAGN